MRFLCRAALAALVSTGAGHRAHGSDLANTAPPSAAPRNPGACATYREFLDTDYPLTWNGITLYGAYDIGVGWVSHGLPENGFNYEGESLVNRNGNHARFLVAPNNLSQTQVGLRLKEPVAAGLSVVFNASTGINPESGNLANLAATNTINAGLPRSSYTFAGD